MCARTRMSSNVYESYSKLNGKKRVGAEILACLTLLSIEIRSESEPLKLKEVFLSRRSCMNILIK